MIAPIFHAWERRLASVTTDRVVRPFEWGADWIPQNGLPPAAPAVDRLAAFASEAMADSDGFFSPAPTDDYHFDAPRGALRFPSAFITPHPENNTVHARFFPARVKAGEPPDRRRAVVVLPQWNADPEGHVGLCRLLAWFGINTLRLSLPYHDARMPPELHRADYIVSANLGRTLQVCRQAVLDARRAIQWLAATGHERVGVLGTSLGSCLARLTACHEPLVRAAALNHISPYFADVVWRGLSTAHVRQGLDGHVDLDLLRRLWMPISPKAYIDRLRGRRVLLVYAKYDLSFPIDLSKTLVDEFRARGLEPEVAVLPCGHYSTGLSPFKWMDGYVLTRFLHTSLSG